MNSNILTDEMLVKALIMYEETWLENSKFDESEFNPSEKFTKKINRIVKSYDNVYYKLTLTKARRIAVIVAAIIAIMCSSLSVGAVRQALNDFFVKTFSTHDRVSYDKEVAEEKDYPEKIEKIYELGYVPDGFELLDYSPDANNILHLYASDENMIMFMQQVKSSFSTTLDNEYSTNYREVIDGQEYLIYEHYERNVKATKIDSYTFIWDNGEYVFELNSNLPKNEILNLCKSLKIKEN